LFSAKHAAANWSCALRPSIHGTIHSSTASAGTLAPRTSANSLLRLTRESCNLVARFTSNSYGCCNRPRAHKTLCARGLGHFELLISKKGRRRPRRKNSGLATSSAAAVWPYSLTHPMARTTL